LLLFLALVEYMDGIRRSSDQSRRKPGGL
jgi:hypothetical protein